MILGKYVLFVVLLMVGAWLAGRLLRDRMR